MGRINAQDEINSKRRIRFNSNSSLITFAKRKDEEDNAVDNVKQLREQQEETIPPQLENSKFRQAYLDKRFSEVSKSLNQQFVTSYKDRLSEVVPDYFNDNRSEKDRSYVTKIRRMYISDVQQSNKYKEQDNVLTNLIESYVQPEVNETNTAKRLKREIAINKQRRNQSNDREQRAYYAELINKQQELLDKEDRKISKQLNELADKNKQFISISQKDKQKLGLTKDQYSVKELEKIRVNVRKQIRQQDQNFYNTRRIALTELNAAYNLGRLDYYLDKGIEYVRWEVSVEHKRRQLNSNNNSDARTIKSYNNEKYYGNLAGKYKGVVCPVCWERNGKVYSINEITTNAELQIPVHPFCACILVPVKDDDDDNPNKKKKFKVKTSDLLNNSVLKWAAGAGVVILGTAAMYAAFRMTRGKVIQPPLQDQLPKVTKLLPKQVKVPDYIRRSSDSVIDTIIENKDQILDKVDETQDNLVPLPELQPKQQPLLLPSLVKDEIELDVIPLGIPKEQIDVTPYQAVINNSLSRTRQTTNSSYSNEATSALEEVIKQRREFNVITTTNPTNTVRTEVDEIRSRLEQYQSYLRNQLTGDERKRIIQDYRNDISKLNNIISKYEKDNVLIYGEIRVLTNLRDEGEQLIARNLDKAAVDNAKIIFANSDIGRKINEELVQLDATLRSRINDINTKGSYYDQAKQLKQQIANSNNELTIDYLNSIKRNVTNSVNNLPNFPIQIEDSLNNLVKLISNKAKLTSEEFLQYSDALDELTDIVKRIDRRITSTLLDVDLQTVIANTPKGSNANNDLLGTAQFLLDYQDGIRQLYNRINNLNVAVILKFNS